MSTLNPNNWTELLTRLLLSLFVGAVIGWNRQRSGKPAGLRTHMLVSLGSAFFVMIPILMSPGSGLDIASRTIQGIATGIGFIGAGEILHIQRQSAGREKQTVKGLTSAAALWVTAAMGAAAGAGLWQLCLLGVVLTQVVLSAIKHLEDLLFPQHRIDE
jgi:putative Mg2+ transporter-C (MgtC) family protein